MLYTKTAIAIISAALAALSCSGLMTRHDRSVSDLESELAVLKKRITIIDKKNALLEAENSDHKDDIRRIKNDYAVLKNQSDARIRDLADMNARLKADYLDTSSRLNAIIAGLEKKIAEKSEELSRMDTALEDLQSDADLMRTELKKKEADIALGEKKNRDLASEIEKMKAGLEKSDSLLKDRETAIRSLKGEIDSLNSSLKEKSTEISGLKVKVDSLESNKTNRK